MNYRESYIMVRGKLAEGKRVELDILKKYGLIYSGEYPLYESNLTRCMGFPEITNKRRLFYRMNTTDLNTHNSIIDFDEYCLDYFVPYIKPDDVIVDAGGYAGSFGFWVKCLHSNSRVVVVEPVEENCKLIRMLFEENGLDYFLYEFALDIDRTVKIQQLKNGYHHYVSQVYTSSPSSDSVYKICKGINIGDLIKKHGNIRILKIDVEGSEWVIFRQLIEKNLLKDIQFIVGEYHGGLMHDCYFPDSIPKDALMSIFRGTHDVFGIIRERQGSRFDDCFVSLNHESVNPHSDNFCAMRL